MIKTREISFRAWDEKKKIMHFDFQFIKTGNEGNDWILFVSDKQPIGGEVEWDKNPHFSQQLKIMQYSGIEDINGKKIYEGDVVKSTIHNPTHYQVEFIEGGFCCTHPLIEGYPIDINHFSSKFKVVGNIFENPELLGAKPNDKKEQS